MPLKYTTPYNISYPEPQDPIREGQAAIKGIAEAVNQHFTNANIPPGNPNLNAVLTRVAALESAQAKAPLGIIKLTMVPAESGYITAKRMVDTATPVALKAGRLYRIDYSFSTLSPVAHAAADITFAKTATTESGFTGTALRAMTAWTSHIAYSGKMTNLWVMYTPSANETVRISTTAQQVVGTGGVNLLDRQLTITDLGKQL